MTESPKPSGRSFPRRPLPTHAAKSEKAAKIIRDCVITRKAPGRAVLSKVTYQRTTTETSNVPLKKGKGENKAT